MTHEGMALGLDLGGSKISAVVLDARGQEHWRQRVVTQTLMKGSPMGQPKLDETAVEGAEKLGQGVAQAQTGYEIEKRRVMHCDAPLKTGIAGRKPARRFRLASPAGARLDR